MWRPVQDSFKLVSNDHIPAQTSPCRVNGEMISLLHKLGQKILEISETTGYTLKLLSAAVTSGKDVWKRRSTIIERTYTYAISGLPVMMIVALFTGMVMALQSGIGLARWGQEEQIGPLVALSMFREMGPVMTGFIIAALIGSSIATEIGTMKISEEIDALEVMSVNPLSYLIMPRIIAVTLICPLLTVYTNLVGLFGGALVGKGFLDVSFQVYFDKAFDVVDLKDLYSGIFKAFIFGITIAAVGAAHGMRASGGALGVGRATIKAVVVSFIFILLFDYLITWAFYK